MFISTTIPSELTKRHTTKEGTWGVIRVSAGQLEYTVLEPRRSVQVLDEDNYGVIEPTMLHQIKTLSEDVDFVVEFWRLPGTGLVKKKLEGPYMIDNDYMAQTILICVTVKNLVQPKQKRCVQKIPLSQSTGWNGS